MKCFVTVGTTEFDQLIQAVDSSSVRAALSRRGIQDVVCQIGRGRYRPTWSHFEFAPDIPAYIREADLVISHAGRAHLGAGAIIETLRLHKPLIVVINSALMHNHQYEIASELSQKGCLTMVCDPSALAAAVSPR
jgi:UDP-N-acetylglucosamine transferase subunit ALG13